MFLLSVLSASSLYAQMESKGTDFIFSLAQVSEFPNAQYNVYPNVYIRIVASEAASGTISFTNMTGASSSVNFNVAANDVHTYELTQGQVIASYNMANGVSNKSIRVNSDVPVSVFVLSTWGAMADATNILPVTTLGNEYYHTGRGTNDWANAYKDQYMVVATQNNTNVYENGVQVANLAAGQVYFFRVGASSGTDLTGYHITSNNPIAYFSAHSLMEINGGADNVFQQLTPVNTWGTSFIVPVSRRQVELIRVVASQNGTTITPVGARNTNSPYSPITTVTLDAGEWVEWRVTLGDNGCYIQSDKPIQVCSYMVGQSYGQGSTSTGDEGLTWIPPIEQSVKIALFAPFAVNILTSHYALIVTPTATKNNTTMSVEGGTPTSLSGGTWYDNPASGMSFYNVEVENNSNINYIFENQTGLVVYGYGFGVNISYYYMAASALRNLETAFYVNDVHYQDLADETLCQSTLNLRALISGDVSTNPGYLKWYINNVEDISARDRMTWTKSGLSPGSYQIRMVVLSDDNVTTITEQTTITIASPMTPGAISGNQAISLGTTATALTSTTLASGGAGTITYQWQSSPDNSSWTNIAGATNGSTYSPGAPTATTYYRRAATSDCGTAHTTSVQITVTAVGENIITANGTTICSGEVAALSASANSVTGATFRWYNAATGGSLLHTGATYNPSPSSTTTYHVSVSGTSQAESSRKAVTVTVKPTATPDMIKITQ